MNNKSILFFYVSVSLVLIAINDQATWFVMSGVLLVFEWQVASAVLFGTAIPERLDKWKVIRFYSHLQYTVVLIGAFISIKSWFPSASNIGLFVLCVIFFSLKELTFRVSKYQAITSQVNK